MFISIIPAASTLLAFSQTEQRIQKMKPLSIELEKRIDAIQTHYITTDRGGTGTNNRWTITKLADFTTTALGLEDLDELNSENGPQWATSLNQARIAYEKHFSISSPTRWVFYAHIVGIIAQCFLCYTKPLTRVITLLSIAATVALPILLHGRHKLAQRHFQSQKQELHRFAYSNLIIDESGIEKFHAYQGSGFHPKNRAAFDSSERFLIANALYSNQFANIRLRKRLTNLFGMVNSMALQAI